MPTLDEWPAQARELVAIACQRPLTDEEAENALRALLRDDDYAREGEQ